MTTCDYYERLISYSLDRELTGSEQAELRQHLAECESCREFQRSLLSDRQLLAALPSVQTSHRQSNTRGKSLLTRIWSTRLSVPMPIAAGIVLLVLSLAALSAFRRTDAPPAIGPAPSGSIDYVQVEVVPASEAKPLTPESHINKR